MLFNSHVFLFAFLPLTIFVYFVLGGSGKRQLALAWVTLASLVFYGWFEPKNLLLIGCSMLGNYVLGCILCSERVGLRWRQTLLGAGIATNLGLLGYYKYFSFVVENVNGLAGTAYAVVPLALPLGISFFTFQQLSYLIDAYRGETREHNFLHYCLFVTFFPHLIAGPLVHHGEMLPQFTRDCTFRPRRRHIEVGLTIFFIGLFKKVVMADGVAEYASPVFAAAEGGVSLTFLEAWCGAIAYTLQLYFDFSAYSDMAIGLARLFGVRLPLNFHSPYKAANIIDFWRRWHMTLSRFLRDYLYIPLGGGRKGTTRRYANLMTTMLLGGLWHGAGWTFILWGGLHGLYLVINHAWRARWTKLGDSAAAPVSPWRRRLSVALTFTAVVVGWVLFRSNNLATAGSVLGSMIGLNGLVLPSRYLPIAEFVPGLVGMLGSAGVSFAKLEYFTGGGDLLMLSMLLAIIWLAPNTQQIMQRFRPAFDTYEVDESSAVPAWLIWRRTNRWAMVMSAVTVVAILHLSRISEFLYFQF
jgi:alginate O-acetyltransferase complex protein AlgI